MTIYRIETTIIPQTIAGRKFADEYEERLRNQGAFDSRNEGTVTIDITASYQFNLIEDSDSEGLQGSRMGSQGSQNSGSEEQA
jgi:hypothetical protein